MSDYGSTIFQLCVLLRHYWRKNSYTNKFLHKKSLFSHGARTFLLNLVFLTSSLLNFIHLLVLNTYTPHGKKIDPKPRLTAFSQDALLNGLDTPKKSDHQLGFWKPRQQPVQRKRGGTRFSHTTTFNIYDATF